MAKSFTLEKNLHFGFRQTCKLIYRYARKRFFEQLKVVSVIIPYLIFFQTMVLRIPLSDSALIAVGLVFVVLGLTFFMEGLVLGLMPLGEVIGVKLPQKSKLPAIVSFAFVLGLGATFAEPAIEALRAAGARVAAWNAPLLFLLLNRYADYLVYSVGIGVGVAVLFGMLRFLYGWSLKPFIYILVSLLVLISSYAHLNPNLYYLLGLAWDCGAVTTGPVTVPLVLALGVGVSRVAGREPSNSGNFGVVSLASLFPVIAVMVAGIINLPKVPEPMAAAEFFNQKNQAKAAVLFSNPDQMRGYALKNASRRAQIELFGDSQKREEYIQRISRDQSLMENLFGSRAAFYAWLVREGGQGQRFAVFPAQEELQDATDAYKLREGSLASFDRIDFLRKNLINAARAIIPLSLFLIFVLLVFLREKLPRSDEVILGLVFAFIGMTIFRGGLEIGLSKVGDQIGKNLPASYASIELPSEEIVIRDFSPEMVKIAFGAEGEKIEFFYIQHNGQYLPVPFEAENYQQEKGLYRYIPSRGPLFGRRERSFIGILVVLAFAFVMGYGATLAEPGLNALGIVVEETTVGTFKKSFLMRSVGVGVGVGIVAGIAKIIWDLPLFWMLAPTYMLLLLITVFSTEEFVNIGWDSAGVTTGPVTVPLVLSVGLSVGAQVGVVEGFGVLALASAGPILSVLLVGLYVQVKRKAALEETFAEGEKEILTGELL